MLAFPSKRRQTIGLLMFAALCVSLTLTAGGVRAAQGDKDKGGKTDTDKIQGAWDVTKLVLEGQDVPEEILKEVKVVFKGDEVSVTLMGADIKGSVKIDASKKPMHIDLVMKGDELPPRFGIFEFDGDNIKIHAGETKETRPKDFKENAAVILVIKKAPAGKTDKKNPANRSVEVSFTEDQGKTATATQPPATGTQTKPAVKTEKGKGKTDHEKIQGAWVIKSGVKGKGGDMPKEMAGKIKFTFADDKLNIEVFGTDDKKGGVFKIDDKTKPGQIELVLDGKAHSGIYEFEGDTLKICVTEAGEARPKEFKAPENSNNMLLVFERERAEKKGLSLSAQQTSDAELAPFFCYQVHEEPETVAQGGKDTKSDKDLIQGTWSVEKVVDDGMEYAKEFLDQAKFMVKGDKIEVTVGDAVLMNATYKVDETKKPKTVDLDVAGGPPIIGIYEMTGDTVKFCMVEGGKDAKRPTEFKAEAGSGFKLIVLKRAKEEKKGNLDNPPAEQFLVFEAAQDKAAKGADKDQELMQGAWQVTSATSGGMALPAEIVAKIQFIVKGDAVILQMEGEPEKKHATFKLDSSKKPKHIDIMPSEPAGAKVETGIYELNGDTLRICTVEGAERPKEFKSEAGGMVTVIELKRIVAKKGGPEESDADEFLVVAAAQDKGVKDGSKDKDLLLGTWQVTTATEGGVKKPPEETATIQMVFASDKITLRIDGVGKDAAYKIDASKKPKQIEITPEGSPQKLLGIFELAGDSLKLCVSHEEGMRPTEFKSDAGSKVILIELKRVAEKKGGLEEFEDAQLVLSVSEQDKAMAKGDKDRELFQGTWQYTKGTAGGTMMPADALAKLQATVKGDTLTIFADGQPVDKGTLSWDTSKNPKQIDIVQSGEKPGKTLGIYVFDGDILRICLADAEPRPKEFKSEAGSKVMLFELRRVVEKKVNAQEDVHDVVSLGQKEKGDKDGDLLQGTWEMTSFVNGNGELGTITLGGHLLIVKGDKISFQIGVVSDGKEGTYSIDFSKMPRHIDISPKVLGEVKFQAIYELTGDTLKICGTEEGNRPTEFKAPKGGNATLIMLKRVVEKKSSLEETGDIELVAFEDEEQAQAGKKQSPANNADLNRIMGVWKMVHARGDGEDGRDELVGPVRMTFDTDGTLSVQGTASKETGAYTLDAAANPKQITFTIAGQKQSVPGIYMFDGKKLVLCFPDATAAGKRPTEFTAGKGSKQILFVLEQTLTLDALLQERLEAKDIDRRVSANNLRQIGMAMHIYHDSYKGFPAHAIYSKDGKTPLLSWRVAILPFIEEGVLYDQFKLDEPWDSPHNKKLIAKMPKIYQPVGQGVKGEGLTYYQVFTGKMTPFDGPNKMKFGQFTDGTSNTIMVVEGKNSVLWTKPDDLTLPKPGDPMPELGGMFATGMNLLFADGAVRWVKKDIDAATLRALVTPSGGEVVVPAKYELPTKDDDKMEMKKEVMKKAADKKDENPKADVKKDDAKKDNDKPDKKGEDSAKSKSRSNLKQIGMGMHSHHDKVGFLPRHALYGGKDDKTPLLSWRVAILPYIEEEALYKQFKLDEAWDSVHNKKLIAKMPKIYEPVGNGKKGEGLTYYQVFTGKNTPFDAANRMKYQLFTDGTSNTGLVFEAKEPVVWTKPEDLVLPKTGEKWPELGGMLDGGMYVLFCDGSLHWTRTDIDEKALRALISPSGDDFYANKDLEPRDNDAVKDKPELKKAEMKKPAKK
ncbi:MAG TPA: TIGR03067 domain-containing protein [Gemmataceae bacterium]|nr:TIGR03067 domain-containing protein [Gemmataceae bacterium]